VLAERARIAELPSTMKIDTAERERMRAEWVTQLYANGGFADLADAERVTGLRRAAVGALRQARRLDLVMGPPAAGKSSVYAEPLVAEHGAILADADEAKKLIPEFEGGRNATCVHEESTVVCLTLLRVAQARGDNVVAPVVGRTLESLHAVIDLFVAGGYEVHLHYNELPADEAARRAVLRFYDTGRFVDPAYVLSVGESPRQNFDILKRDSGRVRSYDARSNDVPKGHAPKVLESGSS
jgi:predicted ABC-type ATPase